MTIRRGRYAQVPFVMKGTVEEINQIVEVVNQLFDGILGRPGVTQTPQFVLFKVLSSIPTATELNEGEVVFYESGTTRRLYTKVNGSIRYAALT